MEKGAKKKGKGGKAIFAILLIGGLAVGGYFLYKKYGKKDETEPVVEDDAQKALDETVKRLAFQTNSSVIKTESLSALKDLSETMKADPKLKLAVAGHTDNIGNDQANLALSKKRAQAVASYLSAQGIAPDRFSVKGFGDDNPVASNDTAEGRAQNRRVEMKYFA
jgi:OmpA-OmpF porin, OOP family